MMHDIAAEKAVIGSCLVEGDAIGAARQFVAPMQFSELRNGQLFAAAVALHDGGKAVDIVTLPDEMRRSGTWDGSGGKEYLGECLNAVATAAHAGHYARIVARHFYEREIAKAARALADNQESKHLEEIAALVMARTELDSPETFNYATSLYDALEEIMTPSKEPVYKFHLRPLDAITDGMKKGEVATIGAATNQGKSLLLLNLMDLQAQSGVKCLFVGSEMTARETFARHLSMRSGIPAYKIRLRNLSAQDRSRAHDAIADHLYKFPIEILDDPSPTLERIESTIARTKPDAVFVDYLQRMSLPQAKDLRLSVNEFMRRLKGIARKRNVMVILASQLNRTTYAKDNDSAPTLADLSESSAIEKESDRVFLMWRPKMLQPSSDGGVKKAVVEIIKAKDRHGPNGLRAHLELDGNSLMFQEIKNEAAQEKAEW